jgi:hypothetical protein
MPSSEDWGVEAGGDDVVPFFLETGIVSSLLAFQTPKPFLPKEEFYACSISSPDPL